MPPPPERRWPGIVAGYAIFAGLLCLAGTPAYYYAEPPAKPLVVRLVVGILLGVALVHIRGELRTRMRARSLSALEAARRVPTPEAELAPAFLKLRDELMYSRASQRYFTHILRPHLLALIAGRGEKALPEVPARPTWRRLLGRGPTTAGLQTLITRMEELP